MQRTAYVSSKAILSGWYGIALLALGFIALFLLNYLVPIQRSGYANRLWNWNEVALTVMALPVIIFRRRFIDWITILTGAALGLISGWSYFLHNASLLGGMAEGVAVWLTFMAGKGLFHAMKGLHVTAFQPPLANIARGMGIGLLAAIPFALLNNLFFYLQKGAPQFERIIPSAVQALSPGIHEEVVYRYFILALCLTLLQNNTRPRLAFAAAIILAVVPHSLLHLPDLFLTNPLMGIFILAATSLLFGLPMALLQIKRGFESAVVFHWFIDFFRFFFGY